MKNKKQVQVDVDITDMPLSRVISVLKQLEDDYGKESYLELEEKEYSTEEKIVLTYYRDKTERELKEEKTIKKAREEARKAQYERLKAEFEGE